MGRQPDSGGRRRGTLTVWQRLQVALISRLGVTLIGLVNRTLRYESVGTENLERARRTGAAIIYSFWHNQLFSAIYFFRARGIAVMVSSHFDGEYSSRMARHFGYVPARGSSSQGSLSALRELGRHLESGGDVAFTVDGPRGPRYLVKNGPLWLSAHSGCAIAPFCIQPERYWEVKSWDRFRIPKPFSRVVVRFGEPIQAEADDESWLTRFQEAMDRLQATDAH